jgi:hypothetical protein
VTPLILALVVLAVALVAIVWHGGGITPVRKALGMAIAPWLALPLADWISAGAVDSSAVGNAIVATVLAVVTYFVPNAQAGR